MNRFNLPDDPMAVLYLAIGLPIMVIILWLMDNQSKPRRKEESMSTNYKVSDLTDTESAEIITWWLQMGCALGGIGGIINGILICLGKCPRTTTTNMPYIGSFVAAEFALWFVAGLICGICVGFINMLFLHAGLVRSHRVRLEERSKKEDLKRAASLLTLPVNTPVNNEDLVLCIRQAQECVARAMKGT